MTAELTRVARASDADRDRTLQRLQQAFVEGHLTLGEMEQRLEVALTATTHDHLAPILADLPGPLHEEPVELISTSGRITRGSNWRVPRVLRIDSEYGGVDLDLSKALIEHPEIEIDLQLRYGSARIVLPLGATVDIDRVTTQWGSTTYRAPRRTLQAQLHVRVTGELGYGRLKVRHRRA